MATLEKAVVKGLAEDKGLYMPENIKPLPKEFFDNIDNMSFQEIAYTVADAFFGEDVDADSLKKIVYDTLAFDCPVVPVSDNIYTLELFHGPTLAFKDVGARFMARLLQYFLKKENNGSEVNVLVATSGDTGSAVANGFLGVDGIKVYVLYPKGKVSPIQECQFTTLGKNITAIEVDGVFDDCQALVKSAFMDADLNAHMKLTSANSINVARFLPQAFYYFYAYAQMKKQGKADQMVMCVPSGNFGNICAALFGHRMGLPIKRFVAANNANPQPVYRHLQAQIMFSQKKYQEAYDLFTDLYRNTDIKSPELLFESARCKEMLNAPVKEVIALLDSAINTTDTLRILEAAPYFLERANVYHAADSFRQAVFDYNRYEYLMQGRVNANFYYIREQAEVKSRLFQQALTDIARAIILAPREAMYYAEMASLQLRVNMADKALQTAERCVAIAPEYSDGYLLLGLAQIHTNEKEKGLGNLRKALEMGNEQAQGLLDKYGK